MKVLLFEDVEKLGFYGEVVDVSEGYARNYLLPRRLAVVPSEQKIKDMAEEKVKRDRQRKIDEERLQKAADAINDAEAVIAAKANEQGHLFGSIEEAQIAENLRQQGFQVDEKHIHFDEHIKEVGQYTVRVKFSANVTAKIKVTVVPQGQGQGAETADDSQGQKQTE